jgi:hypothetical protein
MWTALSALRSGSPIKSRKQIYNLIDKHAKLSFLFDSRGSIDQKEFDNWHKKTTIAFCKAEPDLNVGWATKIINVYLKTRGYLSGDGRKGLVAAIHPPIDNSLVKELKKAFPHLGWKIERIKGIRSYDDDYMPFIRECRSLAKEEGCHPIELECYWQAAR